VNIDIDKIIKRAQEQGFRYRRTEKNHHQFYAPNGHDIITHSSTGSDSHGDDNFMADMKRAGYAHGMSSLGDALQAAGAKANGGAKLSVMQYVIDALARHPDGLSAADIKAIVKSMRPEVADNAAYSSLSQLGAKGIVTKSPAGIYKLTDVDRSQLKTFVRGQRKAAVPPAANAANGANGAAHHEAGARTGDATIDADLQALDNALAALAHIESVVRKNRDVLAQLARLKTALGVP
jgi:Fe2+ or Zn2+ uptake regulation protein